MKEKKRLFFSNISRFFKERKVIIILEDLSDWTKENAGTGAWVVYWLAVGDAADFLAAIN